MMEKEEIAIHFITHPSFALHPHLPMQDSSMDNYIGHDQSTI